MQPPPAWPRLAPQWMKNAVNVAQDTVKWRLGGFALIAEDSVVLADTGIRRALALATRLEAVPGCFLTWPEFRQWFREMAHVFARMALPETPLMQRVLARLPPEQRRLVVWLYALGPSAPSLAAFLGHEFTPAAASQQAAAAYEAFRGALTAEFGVDDPDFPPPPAMETWFIPDP